MNFEADCFRIDAQSEVKIGLENKLQKINISFEVDTASAKL